MLKQRINTAIDNLINYSTIDLEKYYNTNLITKFEIRIWYEQNDLQIWTNLTSITYNMDQPNLEQ